MAFTGLPKNVQDLQATVASGITGSILGASGLPDSRMMQAARASLVVCYRYSPLAPPEVLAEAAIRCAGHIIGTRPHASKTSTKSPSGTEYDIDFLSGKGGTGALRASGGMSLLSPYKVRRAGVIG